MTTATTTHTADQIATAANPYPILTLDQVETAILRAGVSHSQGDLARWTRLFDRVTWNLLAVGQRIEERDLLGARRILDEASDLLDCLPEQIADRLDFEAGSLHTSLVWLSQA